MLEQKQLESLSTKEKFTELKTENQRISNLYLVLSHQSENENQTKKASYYKKKAEELQSCSSIYLQAIDKSVVPPEEKIFTFYCHNRFCPICIYKNSKQIFKLVLDIVNHPEAKNYSYVFMTLTIKNCKAEDLPDTITQLLEGYRSLMRNKNAQLSKRVLGTFRCLESTYNYKNKTFHPHLHVLLMLDKSYFKDAKKYLTKERLAIIWQNALKVDYTPVVDIRKTYNASGKTVAEVSKYTVKSSEINNADVLATYDNSFKRRRLRSFTGRFREIKNLVLEDWEKDNGKTLSYNEVMSSSQFIKNLYRWNYFKGQFELTEKRVTDNKEAKEKYIDNLVNEALDIEELKDL